MFRSFRFLISTTILLFGTMYGALPPVTPFLFGVGTHHPDSAEYFSLMKQAGVQAIRDDFTWSRCETEKGKLVVPDAFAAELDRSLAQGLSTIVILDYANKFYDDGGYPRSEEAVEGFARYAEAVVKALKGRVRYYQVWNEWDGGCGMAGKGRGDAPSYVKLAKAVYPRIKAVDPDCIVLANSVCTGDAFLKETVELGVLKACDALALHTYFYGDPIKTLVNHWWPRMKEMDDYLRSKNGGKPFPLYATEIGWPTQIDPRGVSETVSADQMAKLYPLAMALGYLKGLWWYDFRDDGWDAKYNENNFGMVRRDNTPKKSYWVYKDLTARLSGASFAGRIDTGDSNVWALQYRKADGKTVVALWSETPDQDVKLTWTRGPVTPILQTQPGYGTVERLFQKTGDGEGENRFEIVLKDRVWLLEGDLSRITLAKKEMIPFRESSRPAKVELRTPTVFGRALAKSSPSESPAYAMGDESTYRRTLELKRSGRSDLDASMRLRWDKERLYLTVDVTDDVFFQDQDGANTWQGDGIQFALHPFGEDPSLLDHFDYDVALGKSGTVAWCQFASRGVKAGAVPAMNPKVTRNGNQTRYEVEIPAALAGLGAFRSGLSLGFSLVVNDNDGKGRKGYLYWGDGIGASKDPSLYALVVLED